MPDAKYTIKQLPMTSKIVVKMAKLRQIWSHLWYGSGAKDKMNSRLLYQRPILQNCLPRIVTFLNDGYGKFITEFFLKKMGQLRPLFVYFRPLHIPIQMTIIQFEQYKLKKRRWCAWDSNLGRPNGRRRQIH